MTEGAGKHGPVAKRALALKPSAHNSNCCDPPAAEREGNAAFQRQLPLSASPLPLQEKGNGRNRMAAAVKYQAI
ncbi:MAG TPA: hypothetical protein VKA18_13120, partial [Alphaproteobacteria bacterium]|nr:hypothetical protein [Alphaproteobacteria bacterium]